MADKTTTITLRLDPAVNAAIGSLAERDGYDVSSYVMRLIRQHAAHSDAMSSSDRDRIVYTEKLIGMAVATAQTMDAAGLFDPHFTLSVIRALTADHEFMAIYEDLTDPNFDPDFASHRASINMSLGWHIARAVKARAITRNGGPLRAQVRQDIIKSYTLLEKDPDQVAVK